MNIDEAMKGYMKEDTRINLVETKGLIWVGDPLRITRDYLGQSILYDHLASGPPMREYCGGQLLRVPQFRPDEHDKANYLTHRKMPLRTTWRGESVWRAAFEVIELDERCRVGEKDREEMDLYLTQRKR